VVSVPRLCPSLSRMTLSIIAIVISALALSVSAIVAWFTLFRKGTVKMTQPTIIYFGPDSPGHMETDRIPKVVVRALLIATSKRGRIIESIYVRLSRNGTKQVFNIWAYGHDRNLVRGSGLFVPDTGVEAYHHFLPQDTERSYSFCAGTYRLEVLAHLLGENKNVLLQSQVVEISKETEKKLTDPWAGVYFDWHPESQTYTAHVKKETPNLSPSLFDR
jgi:hypothetical protein